MIELIEPLTKEHCRALGPNLRECDMKEIWLSHHVQDGVKGLDDCRKSSCESWCWSVGGKPVAAFGVCLIPYVPGYAIPWLLGSREIYRNIDSFLRISKLVVERWIKNYAVMVNFVHIDNHKSIKWLIWLGFTIFDCEEFGLEGELFYRFEIRRVKDV